MQLVHPNTGPQILFSKKHKLELEWDTSSYPSESLPVKGRGREGGEKIARVIKEVEKGKVFTLLVDLNGIPAQWDTAYRFP